MTRTNQMICITAALVLAACNDNSSNDDPKPAPDDLSPGVYQVSSGDANAPTAGRYYAADNGQRLLLLHNNSSDVTDKLYRRRDSQSDWQAIPAADATAKLLRSDVLPTVKFSVDQLAGNYVTQIASGVVASFSVTGDGSINPGSSNCKLSGKLSAGNLPNTVSLKLSASNCGNLPASVEGVAINDKDDAPASFRLVGDNGTAILDLWVYPE